MISYKQTSRGGVLRNDGAFIPENPRNRDWQGYLKWLAEGNTPEPSQSSEDARLKAIKNQIQALEAKVTARRVREAILRVDGGWLIAIDTKIQNLRNQLP